MPHINYDSMGSIRAENKLSLYSVVLGQDTDVIGKLHSSVEVINKRNTVEHRL